MDKPKELEEIEVLQALASRPGFRVEEVKGIEDLLAVVGRLTQEGFEEVMPGIYLHTSSIALPGSEVVGIVSKHDPRTASRLVEYVRRQQPTEEYEREIEDLREDLEEAKQEVLSLRQRLEGEKVYFEGLLEDVQRLRVVEFRTLLYATLGMAWVVTTIGVVAYFWK
jgi:hypothetical protein